MFLFVCFRAPQYSCTAQHMGWTMGRCPLHKWGCLGWIRGKGVSKTVKGINKLSFSLLSRFIPHFSLCNRLYSRWFSTGEAGTAVPSQLVLSS